MLSGDHAAHEALDLHVAGWNTDDEGDTPASSVVVEQDQEESVGATEEMLDDAEFMIHEVTSEHPPSFHRNDFPLVIIIFPPCIIFGPFIPSKHFNR